MQFENKICVSVFDTNFEELIKKTKQAQTKSEVDLVEVRFDYLSEPKVIDIMRLKEKISGKIIFTCRKVKDGGQYSGHYEDWKIIIETALKAGFEYVDIEFPSNKYLDLSQKHLQTKVILSVHNFNETPGYRNLRSIQKKMRAFNPALTKFATHIKTDKDIKNLLRLLVSSKKTDQMIVIGMGEKGKITRLIGPMLGSRISFVSFKEPTASGQFSLDKYLEAKKNLNQI